MIFGGAGSRKARTIWAVLKPYSMVKIVDMHNGRRAASI